MSLKKFQQFLPKIYKSRFYLIFMIYLLATSLLRENNKIFFIFQYKVLFDN